MTDVDKCLALALEGEDLCEAGHFRSGVQAFQRALQIGTPDLSLLSKIYAKLGSAYFSLKNYDKALEFATKDMRIVRETGDTRWEAKAWCNIAVTLKCLGQYDEAVACGQRQLELTPAGDDPVTVGLALYHLGNIHFAKAKAVIGGMGECYEAPPDARVHLDLAVGCYSANYDLFMDFGCNADKGQVCGDLGSAEFLLGNLEQAVMHYMDYLFLARECHDVPAERRAYTNLGNCHIFLGQYTLAEKCYLKALSLIDNARDPALEAQTCYSLGNTYSLLNQHAKSIEHYDKHYHIARTLRDPVGEGRACWSLGAAYAALGQRERAVHFAREHYRIAQELGDDVGAAFAQSNVNEYAGRAEGQPASPEDLAARIRRISMEHLGLLRLSPDMVKSSLLSLPEEAPSTSHHQNGQVATVEDEEEEDLLDLIVKAQSKRLDDQRCSFVANKENRYRMGNLSFKTGTAHGQVMTFEDLIDMIAGVQSKRLDEQRANPPSPDSSHHVEEEGDLPAGSSVSRRSKSFDDLRRGNTRRKADLYENL